MYVTGATGVGKSYLLRTMAAQEIAAGAGLTLFDPHGDLAREVALVAQEHRPDDLVLLDFTASHLRWHFNPVAWMPENKTALGVAEMVEVFKRYWTDDWGPRLEHLLRNVLFTLAETPGSTFADIPELLSDRDYRRGIAARLNNPAVRSFWFDEFAHYSPAFQAVVTAPLLNKLGALLTDPLLRDFLTGDGPQLDLRRITAEGKILIVNLDKGQIGEGPCSILGSVILSHIVLIGLERLAQPPEFRRDYSVYCDEFQTFTSLSIASALSELRKTGIGFLLAHQHTSQLQRPIRDAVFGNVGTIISFRIGADDAAHMAREFAPVFDPEDFVSLPRYEAYIRLLIDGEVSRPFSARTMSSLTHIPPPPP